MPLWRNFIDNTESSESTETTETTGSTPIDMIRSTVSHDVTSGSFAFRRIENHPAKMSPDDCTV